MIARSTIKEEERQAIKSLCQHNDFIVLENLLKRELENLKNEIIYNYEADDKFKKGLAKQLIDILECIDQIKNNKRII